MQHDADHGSLLGQHLEHGLGDDFRTPVIRMQLVPKMFVPQQAANIGQEDAEFVAECFQTWIVVIPPAVEFPLQVPNRHQELVHLVRRLLLPRWPVEEPVGLAFGGKHPARSFLSITVGLHE
jgi:hypothetical protein